MWIAFRAVENIDVFRRISDASFLSKGPSASRRSGAFFFLTINHGGIMKISKSLLAGAVAEIA